MRKRVTGLYLLALGVSLGLAPSAFGALNCSFDSVTGVDFGLYDVFNPGRTTATGSITFRCTGAGGTNLMTMSFSTGSGTFSNRTLISGANTLRYNLYLDAANTQIWGDGTSGTFVFSIDPNSSGRRTVTVYGTIPAGQDVGVGSYTDTITVTMNF
jgi:spore coat protein U-like protein